MPVGMKCQFDLTMLGDGAILWLSTKMVSWEDNVTGQHQRIFVVGLKSRDIPTTDFSYIMRYVFEI